MKIFFIALCFFTCTMLTQAYSFAEDDKQEILEFTIIIENHKFKPEIIEVPQGKKIRLIIKNNDPTIEEFESTDLKREKIVPGNSSVRIILAPLKPGKYHFVGEFHEDTAKGDIIVQ